MGSYTQPSRILDKSHSVLNDALGKIQTDIATNLKNNRARAIEEQKRLEKQRVEKQKADVKKQKDINIFKSKERKMPSVYSVKNTMVDEETSPSIIGELDELSEDDFGGIQFGIEEDLKYLYGELADYDVNSVEYESTKGLVEKVLDEAPVLVDLVNQTVENNKGAWNLNGELLKPEAGINGLILYDGSPEFDLRLEASKNILFGTKQGRFSFESVGNKQPGFEGSSYILYKADDGKRELKIGYQEYKELVENGGSLIGSTDIEPYDKAVKKIWDQNKNAYSQLKTKSTNSLTNVQDDRKVTVRTIVQDFDTANENLEKSITDFVYKGGMNNVEGKIPGYNYAQNFWQMAGGPNDNPEMRVWKNTEEQKQRLSELLIQDVKRKYASETSRTSYVNDREASDANVDIVNDIVNNDSISVTPEISEKYFKNKNKPVGDRVKYGYQDIYDNYNSLSNNNFRGAAEVLTRIDKSNTKNYVSGGDLNSKVIKDNNYKLTLEDGTSFEEWSADPTKIYLETTNNPGTFKKLNIDDFESLMNEVQRASGVTPTQHKKAMKLINMGDTAQEFNEIELANQLS